MLHAGAIYIPESLKHAEDAPPKGSQTGEVLSGSTSGDAHSPYVTCEAHFSNPLQRPLVTIDAKTDSDVSTSLLSDQDNVGVPDYEKLRRAKVATCLDAMTAMRRETEGFLESIEQPHLQVRAFFGPSVVKM